MGASVRAGRSHCQEKAWAALYILYCVRLVLELSKLSLRAVGSPAVAKRKRLFMIQAVEWPEGLSLESTLGVPFESSVAPRDHCRIIVEMLSAQRSQPSRGRLSDPGSRKRDGPHQCCVAIFVGVKL